MMLSKLPEIYLIDFRRIYVAVNEDAVAEVVIKFALHGFVGDG